MEEAKRSKRHTTPLAVDDATSLLANRQKGGKKPLGDSDRGRCSLPPHRHERFKPLKHHEGKDFPPHQDHLKKGKDPTRQTTTPSYL